MDILIVSSQHPREAFISLGRCIQPQILFHDDKNTSREAAYTATQVFRGVRQIELTAATEALPTPTAFVLSGIAEAFARGARSALFILDAPAVACVGALLDPEKKAPQQNPLSIGPYCGAFAYTRLEQSLKL